MGVGAEANTIRIGTQGTQAAAFVAGIFGATVGKGVGVVVDSTGRLGTKGSAQRFKQNIKPMDKASEAILALKPVIFRYKKEIDPDGTPQFGLVAEDVEKVNPDLVARDAKGEVYTVRYDAVNAMLLNEFLKEHRKVEKQARELQKQEATIAELKSTIAQQMETMTARLKEHEAQIQRVSDQIQLSRPAPQIIASDR